jgi:hypothetical protein
MNKTYSLLAVLAYSIAAQNVVVSKDSLNVYNNPALSMTDAVVFKNIGPASTFCDSARIVLYHRDTSGGFSWDTSSMKVMLTEIYRGRSMEIPTLNVRKADTNEYRLLNLLRMASEQMPFTMYPGDSTMLSNLQIVNCPTCTPPRYPRYVSGLLRMYFHGGQTVGIRLYSHDFRLTPVKRASPARLCASAYRAGERVLPNGRRIPEKNAAVGRQRMCNRTWSTR